MFMVALVAALSVSLIVAFAANKYRVTYPFVLERGLTLTY